MMQNFDKQHINLNIFNIRQMSHKILVSNCINQFEEFYLKSKLCIQKLSQSMSNIYSNIICINHLNQHNIHSCRNIYRFAPISYFMLDHNLYKYYQYSNMLSNLYHKQYIILYYFRNIHPYNYNFVRSKFSIMLHHTISIRLLCQYKLSTQYHN